MRGHDIHGLGIHIEDDLGLATFELPHDMGDLLLQGKLLRTVLSAFSQHE